jgi:hypothetical protein
LQAELRERTQMLNGVIAALTASLGNEEAAAGQAADAAERHIGTLESSVAALVSPFLVLIIGQAADAAERHIGTLESSVAALVSPFLVLIIGQAADAAERHIGTLESSVAALVSPFPVCELSFGERYTARLASGPGYVPHDRSAFATVWTHHPHPAGSIAPPRSRGESPPRDFAHTTLSFCGGSEGGGREGGGR